MIELDAWGCPVTIIDGGTETNDSQTNGSQASGSEDRTGPDAGVALVDRAIDEFVTMSPALAKTLPDLASGPPMAQALLAALLTMSHRPALVAQARELAAALDPDDPMLTERERGHIRTARAMTVNRLDRACAALVEVLTAHPTDLLAIFLLNQHYFTSGRITDMVGLVPSVRAHWHDELPLYSYLDGLEAFALEESGDYERAEQLGRQGVAAEPTDLWAVHAVAHVLEMQERRSEGVAWLDENADVLGGGGFAGHLWWHQAIQLWALGDQETVLDRFDRAVYPGTSTEGLDLSNAISLLARLESSGVDVGDRWHRLTDGATARLGQHTHVFNDTHYALALGRAGKPADGRRLIDGMRSSSTGEGSAATVLDAVGVEVAEGMLAFGLGDWDAAAERLAPTADDWWRLGGSKAQRQFYAIVLDDARRRQATA